ncbi:extracellular solute-binding protein [Paenibacillus koleovorans]|uniref:extracellular solute-binding protein n=1 Tax=Paenibacillus koleovorans TaxID=121608 RepID=UPI000FDA7273|nr:extracellular solute-binding protein [Paenibacillus koleovorans]
MSGSRKTFRSRQGELLDRLRDDILSGQLKVGDYLPSEKAIAEDYGISNKTVRKVLDILVAEKLIEKLPRVGNIVTGRSKEGVVTIKLGYHGSTLHETELKELLALFHKAHPNIVVQDVALPNNSPETLQQYMEYGMFDVITLSDTEFRHFRENGSLHLLSPMGVNPQINPFLSRAFTDQETLYLQPFVYSPNVVCYNRDHFAQAGLLEPDSGWTWEELFEMSDKLTVPNERIGFNFNATHRNRISLILMQGGSKFERNAEGKYRLNGSGMMDSFRFYLDILSQRIAPFIPGGSWEFSSEELFAQGKVSMIITTYLSLNHLRKSKIHYELAPLPSRDGKSVTLLIALALAVNKQSAHKDEAYKLVEFLTSPAAQMIIRQKTLSIPALKPAADWVGKESLYRPSRYNLYREIVPTFRLGSELGLSQAQWQTFVREVALYWAGLEQEEVFSERLERKFNEMSV